VKEDIQFQDMDWQQCLLLQDNIKYKLNVGDQELLVFSKDLQPRFWDKNLN
jgi:hypothetical protein